MIIWLVLLEEKGGHDLPIQTFLKRYYLQDQKWRMVTIYEGKLFFIMISEFEFIFSEKSEKQQAEKLVAQELAKN